MKGIFKLASALVVSFFTFSCAHGASDIRVVFDVENPNFSMLALVYNNEVVEIELEEGRAEHVIPGLEAVYVTVYSGVSTKTIYLERGDRGVISFDGQDFLGTFRLSGAKADAAKFMNEVMPAALPDQAYAQPFADFYATTEERIRNIVAMLDDYKLHNCGKFRKMEEGRIRYAYASTYLMFPMAHAMMAEEPGYQPDAAYYDVIRGLFVADADYADIQQYRDFMCEAAHVLDEENRGVTELYPKLCCEMRFIAREISDLAVRQRLLHHIAVPYIEHFGVENIGEMDKVFRTYVTEPELVADYEAACGKWRKDVAGEAACDFKGVDLNGKEYSLADFRGKYVYIDVWATWCGPCRREIPYLQALEKEFEGREIVFLSLSIDKDVAAWKDMVRREGLSGVQLHIGPESDFLEGFEVRSIPRFILLDKEGRVLERNMSRPSSSGTSRHISGLDGI